jgi:hypothetical protein
MFSITSSLGTMPKPMDDPLEALIQHHLVSQMR